MSNTNEIAAFIAAQLELERNILSSVRATCGDTIAELDDEAATACVRKLIRAVTMGATWDRCDDRKTMARLVRFGSPAVMSGSVEIKRADWPRDPEAHAA